MSTPANSSGLVGQSVRRVEDDRLLRGRGTYVADAIPDNCLHASFLRSPHPHAWIRSIDTTHAQALPRVVTVLTGETIEDLTNPFPPAL
jgi:carbon-monoxide dehydrogenase large subunit